jgi:putative mRNA 3-end processing factor
MLALTDSGIYCPAGDFYIDPWRAVSRAVVTHAHSDHARPGSTYYLSSKPSEPLVRQRLGQAIDLQGLAYGESIVVGSARVSLHPAGHMLGAAQVRVEVAGRVAVVTGDYKWQSDATTPSIEPLPCHLLICESTFGLPAFRWQPTEQIAAQIDRWWRSNQQAGKASVLFAYAMGKSQRLLSLLQPDTGPIFLHGAILQPTAAYRQSGVALPGTKRISDAPPKFDWSQSMIIAVPSAFGTPWMRRFGDLSTAMASGWMAIRGQRRRRGYDRGFVISDHTDWPGIFRLIDACQPEQVWVTHGFTDVVSRTLRERGIDAMALRTPFEGESADDPVLDEPGKDDQPGNDDEPGPGELGSREPSPEEIATGDGVSRSSEIDGAGSP